MHGRVREMLIKEFSQVLRDPRMRMIIFVMPVIQLVLFGYVVSTDVRHVATVVYDLDNSVASRDLISRFVESGYFDVVEYVDEPGRARELVDRGLASAILHVDKGLADDLGAGRTVPLQIIVDGSDSNTARIVLDYSSRIVSQLALETQEARLTQLTGTFRQPGQIEVEARAWFNDNLESRNFYVPGVIAIIVTLTTLLLTSMAVVREKEIGTIEQIMVTPITPMEFILGKTTPFALISFIDIVIVTVVGVLWFDVPIRGNLLVLLLGACLYLLTTLAVGLLISTISQTQQQAMMTTFFFYMPAMLLSGFMFPVANMPDLVQWLTCLNPLRYFLVIVRGVFLKGIGLDVLWPQMVAMAVIGVVTLWLAVKRFHKTLA